MRNQRHSSLNGRSHLIQNRTLRGHWVGVENLEPRRLLSSTVAYWRFENGSANAAATGTGTILDTSGNGLNGTAINGPLYSATVPVAALPQNGVADHRSMHFDGVSQRIAIADSPALTLTKSLTLEAYFNLAGM